MHHEVLESGKTINSNLNCQQLEWVNQELIKNGVDSTKTRLVHNNPGPLSRSLSWMSWSWTKNRGARMDSVTTHAIQPWLSAIWLSFVLVNGAVASQYAVHQHSICLKMGRRLLCHQAHSFLRYMEPKPTRKMQEHDSFTGRITLIWNWLIFQ